jgi:hypothetical protein
MRRGSSTVVAIVGAAPPALLETLGRAPNVAALEAEDATLEEAARTLARAEGVASPYVVVAADPLGEVAQQWSAMWSPGSEDHSFDETAGVLVAEWRSGRVELPDYYIVVAAEEVHAAQFHLGFLKSERLARVILVPLSEHSGELAPSVLAVLPVLPQGPWWPAVDRLMDAAREYFPGTITPEARAPSEVIRTQ